MLAPGGESHGRTGEASRGSSVPERGQTGRGAEPGTSDTERGNPILAWLSRNLCLGMREEYKTRKRMEREVQASLEAYEEEEEQLRGLAAKLEESSIRRHEDAAAHRLRSIEDKARANLLSITIGVAVLFAGLDLLAGGAIGVRLAGWLQVSVALGFVASVLYFLLGGLMALKALEVARVFVPSLEEEAERSEVERAMQGLWVLEQNEKTIFLRTNALSSSSYGLRNGVFCLTAMVVLLAGSIVFANLGSPVAKPSDGPPPSGEMDSVRPAAPAPSHPNPTTDPEADPPSVVGDSTALPEVVDTLSGSATYGGPGRAQLQGVQAGLPCSENGAPRIRSWEAFIVCPHAI